MANRRVRGGVVFGVVAVVVLAAAAVGIVVAFHRVATPAAACVVVPPGTVAGASANVSADFTLSPEQTDNAATIAAVGLRLGMPDHAVTVALATAMQESKLVNLTGGDLDSAGLFQQRPSQGWGTYAQVIDPVYAATAFYQHLRAQPDWQSLSVTQAAQQVQRSGAPDAYAQWEPEARALATALTGQTVAGLTCHDLVFSAPSGDLVSAASAEWGTAVLSGTHGTARGWAMAAWLVGHAARLGVDQVSFGGWSWSADAGAWSASGGAGSGGSTGVLSLHRTPRAPSASG